MRLVDDADDVQIPLVGQLVVQAADDVQLGGAAALGLGGALEDLLVGHDVALRALQVGPEGAEGAAVDADVGRVEVRVDVVIGEVAVLALADEVGQFAEREQVGAVVRKTPSSKDRRWPASTFSRMTARRALTLCSSIATFPYFTTNPVPLGSF